MCYFLNSFKIEFGGNCHSIKHLPQFAVFNYNKLLKNKIVNGINLVNKMNVKPIFKADPHNDYTRRDVRTKLEAVISHIMKNSISIYKLSRMSEISESTLKYWKKRLTIDNNWRPWKNNHGNGHRIFTDQEEAAIKSYIFSNFVDQGYYFNDGDFADVIYQAYLEKYMQSEEIVPKDFLISKTFISDFKKRNNISSRRPHVKRRPTIPDDAKKKFIDEMQELLQTIDHSRIINADETSWRCFPGGILTWSEIGSDNVKIYLNGNPKQSITVMAGIKADGTKLPLYIITKGKTEKSQKNLGDISYHKSGRSKNGWTTEETFKDYFLFLRQHHNDNEKIYLIVDQFKAHTTDQIKEFATQLNINLIFIPPGLTDELQPLDRLVFGCLKSTAKRLYKQSYSQNPHQVFNKEVAVQHLIAAWEHVQSFTVTESWSIYTE